MTENDSNRIVAEEYAAGDPKPSLFWSDLADDLRDPEFRRVFEKASRAFGCPTCSGPIRKTVGMVCQTCGTDYAGSEKFDDLVERVEELAAEWEAEAERLGWPEGLDPKHSAERLRALLAEVTE